MGRQSPSEILTRIALGFAVAGLSIVVLLRGSRINKLEQRVVKLEAVISNPAIRIDPSVPAIRIKSDDGLVLDILPGGLLYSHGTRKIVWPSTYQLQ